MSKSKSCNNWNNFNPVCDPMCDLCSKKEFDFL